MYKIIYITAYRNSYSIQLRYTYILYTDRISYFCKKINFRKDKKDKIR